jgi:hypothetical protein
MKLARFFKHHIDLRFIFTPFAITLWTIEAREIKILYIFGVRIARVHIQ